MFNLIFEVMEKKERDGKVINPFLDWSFKYLFGTPESKSNLIGLLNLVLSPDVEIEDVDFMNSESIPSSPQLKGCVFDIICRDKAGDNYLVEMQNQQMMNEVERMIYYTCRLIDRMGVSGREWDYRQIKRVYSICLMNFTFEEHPVLRRDVVLYDVRGQKVFSDKLNIVLLQLPCLRARSIHECSQQYEFLLYLLNQMHKGMKTIEELKLEVAQTALPEETKELFYKVLDTADVASLSESDRIQYESDLKNYRDSMSCIAFAEHKGRAEGLEEGRQEGREEGIKVGVLRTAKKMKSLGIPEKDIAECTGLSVEEILGL